MKKSLQKCHAATSMKVLFILLSGLFTFNYSYAQTYVSGGIYSNTTWTTAGSPYIVTGNITLFTGANLTIQPGVVVKFRNGHSINAGSNSIIAQGTPIDSITFTSDSTSPVAGCYSGLILGSTVSTTYSYCNFFYAYAGLTNAPPGTIVHCTFKSDYVGISSALNVYIDSCNFSEDSYALSNINVCSVTHCNVTDCGQGFTETSNSIIDSCIISNNRIGVGDVYFEDNTVENSQILSSSDIGIQLEIGNTIKYCEISFNGIGINGSAINDVFYNSISNNKIGIEYYQDSVYCNSICNNTQYNVVNENSFSTNEYIIDNYWCTADSMKIDSSIYDGYKNSNLGLLFFKPFNLSPCYLGCTLTVIANATKMIVCAGDSTTLTANISDINPIYTAVWNPGNHTGNTFKVTPMTDITYTVTVTDSSGCKDSAFITIDTLCTSHPCVLSIRATATKDTVCSGNSTTLTCAVTDTYLHTVPHWTPGNYSGVNYTVTPGANTTYTVVVRDSNGCRDSAFITIDTIFCNSSSHSCSLTINTSATHDTLCASGSTTLNASILDNASYYTPVWKPGNYAGYSYTVSPSITTTYEVRDSDTYGCKDSALLTIVVVPSFTVSFSGLPATVCWNSSTVTLTGSPSGGVFSGAGIIGNTFNPSLAGQGNHIISYSYSGICGATVTQNIMVEAPATPPGICYVTTDTSSTFNTVIWQKTGMDTLSVDSVIICRMNVIGNFVPIGEVSVHGHTKFNDYTAQPLVEPSAYALGVIDTCGGDTLLSTMNETVFLQSVASGPNSVNLIWNFYRGSPVIYYRILRDDSGLGNWHAIDSVNGIINAYTDRHAPVNPGLRYMVNTDWNVVCTPSVIKHRNSTNYVFNTDNKAYSNMTKVFPTGIVTLTDNGSIKVYPNPVNDAVSIAFNNVFEGTLKITDVLGQTVYTTNLSAGNGSVKQINVSSLTNGVYFITLEGKGQLYRTKIIKM
jgi:hypothetical protein